MIYRAIHAVLRPVWRLRRGLTLGVQGCVVDPSGAVLLVKHSYRPGWHFPGGGVEWAETVDFALARELGEETGVELTAPAMLHGIFANFGHFPGDHIAFHLVRDWRRPVIPAPNTEIVASGFYRVDALPDGTSPGAKRRLDEIFGGAPKSADW